MTGPRVDVVLYPSGDRKAVPAGKGETIVDGINRTNPGSVIRDRVTLAAAALGLLGGGALALLLIGYSLVIMRALLLGVLAAAVLFALVTAAVGAVAVVRWLQLRDAEVVAADVPLADAREQWEARPVSEVQRNAGTVDSDTVTESETAE